MSVSYFVDDGKHPTEASLHDFVELAEPLHDVGILLRHNCEQPEYVFEALQRVHN